MGKKYEFIIPDKEYNDWTAIRLSDEFKVAKNGKRSRKWVCKCICGEIGYVVSSDLSSGKSKRCMKCAAKRTSERLLDNLEGEEFGQWKVGIRVGTTKDRCPIWQCTCSCGKKRKVPAGNLLQGLSTKCGKCNHYKMIQGRTWTSIVNSAIRRKIELLLTIEEAAEIYEKQNGKCALTGIDIFFPVKADDKGTCSLDRKNANLPYSKENCQWVHKVVNRMKWILDNEEFISVCHLVSSVHTNPGKTLLNQYESDLLKRIPKNKSRKSEK